jgi:tetratricopeptide (TPR) repeat protein
MEATKLYLRAYRGARKSSLLKLEGTVLNNLGQNYRYQGNYPSAVHAFERCIQVRMSERDDFRLAATLSHFGACCLDIHHDCEDTTVFGGNNFVDHPDYWADRAYVNLKKSAQLQKEQGNYWLLDRTYGELSRYWEYKSDEEAARRYRLQALDVRRVKGIQNYPDYY